MYIQIRLCSLPLDLARKRERERDKAYGVVNVMHI